MSTFELLKTANEMTFTDEKVLMLKQYLKEQDRMFEIESKKCLIDEQLLSKSYEA